MHVPGVHNRQTVTPHGQPGAVLKSGLDVTELGFSLHTG